MILIKGVSGWTFITSATGGLGVEFVAVSGGAIYLADPEGKPHTFHYGGLGVGLTAGAKIPKIGKVNFAIKGKDVGAVVAPAAFPNTGRVHHRRVQRRRTGAIRLAGRHRIRGGRRRPDRRHCGFRHASRNRPVAPGRVPDTPWSDLPLQHADERAGRFGLGGFECRSPGGRRRRGVFRISAVGQETGRHDVPPQQSPTTRDRRPV